MENESLSAQIVKLQIINTKFKARIADLEARLKASEDRRNCQTTALKQVNAELEARLTAAEKELAEAVNEAHVIGANLSQQLRDAEADAGRLRALILSKGQELCPCWHLPKKCLKLFRENGEDARCLYCQVAALSPADDEKGAK